MKGVVDVDYQKLAKGLAWQLWGEDFDLPVKINNRLTSTLGYFRHSKTLPIEIDLAGYLISGYQHEQIVDVLKHELCHWYIFMKFGREATKDGNPIFEKELRRIGSSSTRTIEYQGSYTEILCCKCNQLINKVPTVKAKRYANRKTVITRCCNAKLKIGNIRESK